MELGLASDRALRGIFGPKREVREDGETALLKSFMTCVLNRI
jgi:hypothetical protein